MFITVEGADGAGKTTQARLLVQALAHAGHAALFTREPGGSTGAEALRALLLRGDHEWCPQTEVLLHFAARAEHVARTIRPALGEGRVVVCDRFADSTMAYQGYGQGADRHDIAQLSAMMKLRPDLTLILDASPAVAARRLAARPGGPDRYERVGAAFHARVAAGFRAIAAADPARCVTVPADGTEGEVHAAVWAVVAPRLGARSSRGRSDAGPGDTGS